MKVTEQLPDARVHVVELKDPAGPVSVKVTVPVGVMMVPGEVSDTVAVHEEATPTTTGLVQTTTVDVVRGLIVTLAAGLLLLPVWPESPPYVPVMRAEPVAVAVNVTEQVATPVPPATRVHGLPVNEPAGPVSVKLTVPVGVVGLALVSVTVAVHDEAWLTTTGVVQATAVVVAWVVTTAVIVTV